MTSLINMIQGSSQPAEPTIGMGATVLHWSDRSPATIVSVERGGKRIGIQADHAVRTDSNGMSESQTYDYSPNTSAPISWYTRRKNGAYVREGDAMKNGQRVAVGFREKYHDYSF